MHEADTEANTDLNTITELIRVGQELLQANKIENPRLEVLAILSTCLDCDKSHIIANTEKKLTNEQVDKIQSCFNRRSQQEPLAYIFGTKEFCGFDFEVNSSVLIPRPETEILVERGLDYLRKVSHDNLTSGRSFSILDLGTGSGCIAVSLAKFCKAEKIKVAVTALEKSAKAAIVAESNIVKHKCPETVNCLNQDWQDFFSQQNNLFDLVVSNPPYVEEEYSHSSILHEPRSAIFAAEHGAAAIKELISSVPAILQPRGLFICEIGYLQADLVKLYLVETNSKLRIQKVIKDLAGLDRFIEFILS